MTTTNSNVTPIESKQPTPLAKFTIAASIDGFPMPVEVEGKTDYLRAMIERLKAIGATPPEEIKAKYAPYTKDPKPLILSSVLLGPPQDEQNELRPRLLRPRPDRAKGRNGSLRRDRFFSKSPGIKMGKNDVWIAAAAYISGAKLVTTDDDFDHIAPSFVAVDKILYAG